MKGTRTPTSLRALSRRTENRFFEHSDLERTISKTEEGPLDHSTPESLVAGGSEGSPDK